MNDIKLFNNLKIKLLVSGIAISIVLSVSVLFLQQLIFTNSASLYIGTIRNQALHGEFSQVKLSLTQSLLTFKGVKAIFHDSKQSFNYGEESVFGIKLFSYYDTQEKEKMATYTFYYDGLYGIIFSLIMNVLSFLILFVFYKKSKDSINLEIDLQRRAENINTLNWVSKQVSHDLASPLAAMNNLAYALDLNEDQHSLFKAITKRISDISGDLSKNTSLKSRNYELETINVVNLVNVLIPELILEKNIEFNNRFKIELASGFVDSGAIPIGSKEILRILSNLINNAADASKESDLIQIKVDSDDKFLNLFIIDRGRGIPKDILSKLSVKSFNYGKKGSGLGIYGARQILSNIGGKLVISSEFGEGTTVKISIPMCNKD